MCSICKNSPCLSGCPNAPDSVRAYRCKYCGEDIVQGDVYMELEGEFYHLECFEDSAVSILTENYGAIKGVASP